MNLLELLENYQPLDAHETAMVGRLRLFLSQDGEHFGRELAGQKPDWGHVTGSAWVVSDDGAQVILVHHGKLGKWVQPGGHCEGQSDVLEVAIRETREETGLEAAPLESGIFDVDVHEIPEYWNTPAHLHFDVRFLLGADAKNSPVLSDESHDVRWVSLQEAEQLSGEESVRRMIRKTRLRFENQ